MIYPKWKDFVFPVWKPCVSIQVSLSEFAIGIKYLYRGISAPTSCFQNYGRLLRNIPKENLCGKIPLKIGLFCYLKVIVHF